MLSFIMRLTFSFYFIVYTIQTWLRHKKPQKTGSCYEQLCFHLDTENY